MQRLEAVGMLCGMTVSVAMATYNGARWVQQQVGSILAQTLLPAEIVVGDDASTDETVEIVARIAERSPVPIRVERQRDKRLGVTGNFERAMRLCRGDLIALSDQDDLWHPRKLEAMVGALQAHPDAAYAICDARLVDADLRPLPEGLWELHQLTPQRQQMLEGEEALLALSMQNYATGATMLLRRHWLEHALPISPHWMHDGWLALVLSAFSRCVCVPEKLMDYRQHPGQTLGAMRRGELPKVHWQRIMNREFLARSAARWADAYAFLRQRQGLMRQPVDLELIRRRAVFDRDRVLLRDQKETRFGIVAEHLLRGDYGRYAWGMNSVAVDLFWPE